MHYTNQTKTLFLEDFLMSLGSDLTQRHHLKVYLIIQSSDAIKILSIKNNFYSSIYVSTVFVQTIFQHL